MFSLSLKISVIFLSNGVAKPFTIISQRFFLLMKLFYSYLGRTGVISAFKDGTEIFIYKPFLNSSTEILLNIL